MNSNLERSITYMSLDPIVQELFDLLYYPNSFDNVNRISPLEIHLLGYNEFLGEENGVMAVADRIGLDIIYDKDSTPSMQFYVLIKDLLQALPRTYLISAFSSQTKSNDSTYYEGAQYEGDPKRPSLDKVLNMNYPEFDLWMKSINFEPNTHSYRRRLRDYPMYLNSVGNYD